MGSLINLGFSYKNFACVPLRMCLSVTELCEITGLGPFTTAGLETGADSAVESTGVADDFWRGLWQVSEDCPTR